MKPSNHTGSYYAASINKETNYPELQDDHNADICILKEGFEKIRKDFSEAGFHFQNNQF